MFRKSNKNSISFLRLTVYLQHIFFFFFFNTVSQTDCYVSLSLPTASSETVRTKTIKNCKDPIWNETFCFRIQSQVKNVLELKVYDENAITKDDLLFTVLFDVAKIQLGETVHLTFRLNPEVRNKIPMATEREFPPESLVNNGVLVVILNYFSSLSVHFPTSVGRDECGRCPNISLQVELKETEVKGVRHWQLSACVALNLDVRLEFDLCMEEKNFLQKRRKLVASALKKALHLERDLQDHEVPVVAVMTTGGGTRALTSLLGNLLGLQKLDLLDAISYITGSSGSTWTLSHLYQSPDWSHKDLLGPIGEVRRHMTKCKLSCFSLESLKYYDRELNLRKQEGYQISSIDLWGLLLEKALSNGVKNNHKLSDERQALNQGQNPLPIYMILNIKDDYSLSEFKEWVEFTPYEVGFLKYGAFIRAEDFGSKFFMGRLMKKLPESRICFMKGLWSNVFSYNLLDAWHSSDPSERCSLRCTQHRAVDVGWLYLFFYFILISFIIISSFISQTENILLLWRITHHKKYFLLDTVLENFPNQLTETAEFLCLADTAGYIDISYPPLMRPERKVDVVLHLNYSSGSQTSYFLKQGIPFPKIHLSEEEKKNLKECYIFEDAETPEAPTVVFFPLVNDTFRKYKEPGVERSPAEMAEGNVDVSSLFSPYCINSFTYTEDQFDKLVKLTSYNIQNNKHLILKALKESRPIDE
uniref:Phospholipase A2 n=1 Tax=Cairina moschata TaxID=8855 RepID=A0A8C3GEJ2_CAIMO